MRNITARELKILENYHRNLAFLKDENKADEYMKEHEELQNEMDRD